jgi:hypothetical protein
MRPRVLKDPGIFPGALLPTFTLRFSFSFTTALSTVEGMASLGTIGDDGIWEFEEGTNELTVFGPLPSSPVVFFKLKPVTLAAAAALVG